MNSHLQTLHSWLGHSYQKINLVVGQSGDLQAAVHWVQRSESVADLMDAQIGVWTRFNAVAADESLDDHVSEDVRWALDTLSTLDPRSSVAVQNSDKHGAWQVHLVWVIEERQRGAWEHCLRRLRNSSAHAEEIGLDVLVVQGSNFKTDLEKDGIPSLLLNTRRLLSLTGEEMPAWLSPDEKFQVLLDHLPDETTDFEQKEFNKRFLDNISSEVSTEASVPAAISAAGAITIENFRNIVDAELRIDEIDGAMVIHGPNGSGKSSIFEAVSLSLFGTSERHFRYLNDSDIATGLRKEYVQNVLSSYGNNANQYPKITYGGKDVLASLVADSSAASDRLLVAHGTTLAQEACAAFILMDAAQLAARVLGDYSPRSRFVQDAADRGTAAAKEEWQQWLRSIGLSVSITKAETILVKVISRAMTRQVPQAQLGVLDWIDAFGEQFSDYSSRAVGLRKRWADVDGNSGREAVGLRVAKKIESAATGEDTFAAWLNERNSISSEIGSFVSDAARVLEPMRADWQSLKEEIAAWSQWLHRPTAEASEAIAESDSNGLRIAELSGLMAELQPQGQLLRMHSEHLAAVKKTVLPSWSQQNEHTCPTCENVFDEKIEMVVAEVAKRADAALAELRTKYSSLQDEIKALRTTAVASIVSPVSDLRREELSGMFGFAASGPESLENVLRSGKEAARDLFSRFEKLLVSQSWKEGGGPTDVELLARALSSEVLDLRRDGFAKQELPAKWEALRSAINQVALQVVKNHLPTTIEAVWREISLALAPARWNQVGMPDMTLSRPGRGSEQLQITLKRTTASPQVPARHILNQAEQNLLGLSWFFTRHLSHGRFLAPIIAMDDPAQDMDQVTFRRFVRFSQSFLRMHKVAAKEIHMLVTMHQEDRALDLARALTKNGELTFIEWAQQMRFSGARSTMRQIVLRNPEQRAPLPDGFLEAAEPVSTN